MARIPRNYLSESLSLGTSLQSIARELRVSKRQVLAWQMTKPPKAFYEPIRNIARRTTYQYLRSGGVPPERAAAFRRVPHAEAIRDVAWIDNVIDTLFHDWNKQYRAYMRDPAGWIAKHPNKKIPHEMTRDDIRRLIEKGIRNGKSREEIENY
ncbi:hypothetical protein LCGC14_1372180 [marine sediment metagenome]|uniref:Uncharacterized protein n=1 Tax=marine sediment metagenome TaxID=412755 RepID=A0A0F9KR24_9ZZZZ